MALRADDKLEGTRERSLEPALLRDRDIRRALSAWLAREHRNEPSTVIYEELTIPRPTARADIVVVNGSLVGYEIKSDVDSLSRLAMQARSYGHVFERVFLVTSARRANTFSKKIPDWWGVLKAKSDGSIVCVKRGRLNKSLSPEHALHILQRSELRQISKNLGLKISSTLTKSEIIICLVNNVKSGIILSELREQLKSRKNALSYVSSSNSG